MTPEGRVKKKIKDVLKELGAYYAMPMGTGYGNSGVPDFLVCYKGRFVAIESKAGNNLPTALQAANLVAIKKAGGVALVVNDSNVNQLKEILYEEVNDRKDSGPAGEGLEG